MRIQSLIRTSLLNLALLVTAVSHARAQQHIAATNPIPVTVEQPDAGRTKDELSQLLDRYPPAVRNVLSLDPGLLSNEAYLAPYPALAAFLNHHPEVARNPAFYVSYNTPPSHTDRAFDLWDDVLRGVAAFLSVGMAVALLGWLIKTLVDYRRWNRLTKIQTEVHTKLLDRFTANDDLLAYIQSPAGAKFLESTPISLDAGPRSVAAPLGRILWSLQAGLVIVAAGIGLQAVSWHITDEAVQPLRALGVLGVAVGIGFVVSAAISYFVSRRLGLIAPAAGAKTPMLSAQD